MTGPLLTADQVAERIGMRTDFVYQLAREERIPHHRFGRTLRFRAEAIDEWLRATERGTLNGPSKWGGTAETARPRHQETRS